MKTHTPLVINWHLTEACNYRCHYCYATWNDTDGSRDLIHYPEQSSALLSELYRFVQPGNRDNPMNGKSIIGPVRLNLAGGEPLLNTGKLLSIINQARRFGFEVSLISNGSYLSDELLEQLAPHLSLLGISIDSANPATNRTIGRLDRRGRLLNLDDLAAKLRRARSNNPNLRLKLNTVVNSINHAEDLTPLIRSFTPDKWKVLRMLPVVSQELTVSDKQYAAFLSRHSSVTRILCAEDNQDMCESYLMVDPHGRFFQNSTIVGGQGYHYSKPILEVGADKAFAEMAFDLDSFRRRYIPTKIGVGA